MNTLLLAVVVTVAASPVFAGSRKLFIDGLDVQQRPWLGPHAHPGPYLSGGQYSPGGFDEYSDSRFRNTPSDDLNQQIKEVQRRCHDDFLLLRRLLDKQGHPLRGPQPWFNPVFRVPYFPEFVTDTQNPTIFDGFPHYDEVDYEDDYDLIQDSDYADKDTPTSGSSWPFLSFLPKAPAVDDLPDNYSNATHDVHSVGGSRVEVNTTTHKNTGDSHTTFFHTKVIHILPDEEPKEKTPEENAGTTERTLTTDEGEKSTTTTTTSTENPAVEDVTSNKPSFIPHDVPAELVVHEMSTSAPQPARDVLSKPTTSFGVQLSAPYVKLRSKNKKADKLPKDLSGDTLVNHLPGNNKGDKPRDPDAEIIL